MLILLYKGKSIISRIIRWRTWSQYSHAAIIPSDGYELPLSLGSMSQYLSSCVMCESWQKVQGTLLGGVVRRSGISIDHKKGTHVDLFSTNDTFIDVNKVREYLISQLGKPYDFHGVLGFITRRDSAHNPNRMFCSELVSTACRQGGLQLLKRIAPHRIPPGHFALSPELTYIGSAVTGKYPTFYIDQKLTEENPHAQQQ